MRMGIIYNGLGLCLQYEMRSVLRLTNSCRALALTMLMVLGAGSVLLAEPLIERVSFWPLENEQALSIRLHANDQVVAYSEPRVSGGTLEIILFNVSLSPSFRQDNPLGPVSSYSIEPRGGHLAFHFTLDPAMDVHAASYRDGASNDILLKLAFHSQSPEQHTVPAVAVADVPGTSSKKSTVRKSGERWKLDTVVIDAGHGGKDYGATANGVREKDITLAVALLLGKQIEENLGVKVVYTRRDDRFIELKERGRIANRAGGKLFVSIHANAARNRTASGTETFFLGMHKTDAARTVMERENSVVKLESDPDQYTEYNEQALIMQTLANSAYMRKSEQLAGKIENAFARHVGRSSRGVKQAGFYVLWSASMPAVLVELGFVTNPREAAFLKSKKGQANLADAIFRSIKTFKDEYEKDLELVVGE